MSDRAEDDSAEDTAEKFKNTGITHADLRGDDQDWQPLPRAAKLQLLRMLPSCISVLEEWPLMDNERDSVQDFTQRFLAQPQGYSWSLDFSGNLFCELAYEGFLSTSLEIPTGGDLVVQVLLPWNDPTRNTLDWQDVHISRQVRKRAKKYTMTVDTAYDDVILGCVRMHGEPWLYRGLRWLMRGLFARGYSGDRSFKVGVHSFELWDEDGRLVAGDLGYTVGGVYTSMTGFRLQDTQGAGEVQLVLTAALLRKMGFVWWDLGMVMKYKGRLGAKVVDRDAFVKRLHTSRDQLATFSSPRAGGQELLNELLEFQRSSSEATGGAVAPTGGAEPLS